MNIIILTQLILQKSQSPYDNSLNDPKKLIKLIKKLFKLKNLLY